MIHSLLMGCDGAPIFIMWYEGSGEYLPLECSRVVQAEEGESCEVLRESSIGGLFSERWLCVSLQRADREHSRARSTIEQEHLPLSGTRPRGLMRLL